MVYMQGGGLSNEELFQKAFADRFASLDSLVSSSPASEAPCRPCGALLQMPEIGGGASSRWRLLQWALVFLLLMAIVGTLYRIFDRTRPLGAAKQFERFWPAAAAPQPAAPRPAAPPAPEPAAVPLGAVEDVTHPSRVKATSGDRPAVCLLHADWCSHCKKMMPVFRAVAQKYGGQCDFRVCESEVTKGSELLAELNLRGYPMTLGLKNNAVVDQMVGGRESPELEQFVRKLLGLAA
jgi:thiol-disulfide isomerase/thioredoxin